MPAATDSLFATITDSTQSNTSFADKLAQLKQTVKLIKRIPRGARVAVAQSLSECVARVVSENTVASWEEFLTFSYKTFHIPRDSNHRSLTSAIKFNTSNHVIPPPTNRTRLARSSSSIAIIENKLSDGNVKGAAKLLFSCDSLATDSAETFLALRDKHPSQLLSTQLPSPPSSEPSMLADDEITRQAILSFPNGSAGGLDGITAQHLKDLTDPFVGDAGKSLLSEITKLVNVMLEGHVPSEIVPILYGANLIALHKRDGGIRPIAVGNTLRRLTSKLCCRTIQKKLTTKFQPRQLGFGVRSGCEAAVHAARTFLNTSDYEVFVKIDVKNAFNSLDRGVLLTEIQKNIPEVYKYMWQCYGTPSKLMFGTKQIISSVGCQQGDPLGPAIFSLGIHPIISELNSKFNVWYLDDGCLAGSASVVLDDLSQIVQRFDSIGLSLNFDKCEIFIPDRIPNTVRENIFQNFNHLCPNISNTSKTTLTLLGAPIFLEAIPGLISSKLEQFSNNSNRLFQIKPHMAIYILRLCLFTPKFMYLLRCTPMWYFHGVTNSIDTVLKETVTKILNLQFEDRSWVQATLPVSFGGLGIRRSTDVALPAFLASSHGSQSLIGMILNITLADVKIACQAEALTAWSASCPDMDLPSKPEVQSMWDLPLAKITYSALLDQADDDTERARLLAVAEAESGNWLHILPSKNLGSILDPNSLRVVTGLRVGTKLCEPHRCLCGRAVDQFGRHGLSCVKSAGRQFRHWSINDLVRRALSTALIPSTLEPSGMLTDGKRPDGATLVPWSLGKVLVWDATCVDTLAPSHVSHSARNVGVTAEQAQINKHNKYSHLSAHYIFFALAVETMGPWSSDTKNFIKDLSKRLVLASGDPRAGAYFAQRLSLAIQRGNAASILGTLPRCSDLDGVFNL